MKPRKLYAGNPGVEYHVAAQGASSDVAEFVGMIQEAGLDTPVAWFSHQHQEARPGLWLTEGNFRLKNGSFVDPWSLDCYGAQYYEPWSSGRHTCLRIGYIETVPAEAKPFATVGEFLDVLTEFVPEVAAVVAANEAAGQEAAATDEEAAGADAADAAGEDVPVEDAADADGAPAGAATAEASEGTEAAAVSAAQVMAAIAGADLAAEVVASVPADANGQESELPTDGNLAEAVATEPAGNPATEAKTSGDAAADAAAEAEASGDAAAGDVEDSESALPVIECSRLIQPDADFEKHGALTRGWHIQVWEADDENTPYLVVFG